MAKKNDLVKRTVIKEKPFSKMTKAEKRVAIAKDVLKWIKSGLLNASHTYCSFNSHLEAKLNYGEQELNELLPGTTCNVCAKGALFIADIMKRDNYRISIISRYNSNNEEVIAERLSDIFSPIQLDLIECAYEERVVSDSTGKLEYETVDDDFETDWHPTAIAKTAIKFGSRFDNSENLMIGIMKNIIKNNGTFKP